MHLRKLFWAVPALCALFLLNARGVQAQSASITGTVVDPSGGVVPNATVTIHNPVSGLERSTTTDAPEISPSPTCHSIRTTLR